MQSKIELYVSGSGTTVGQIELYPDEPISIEYSIFDVKDISKRNSTVSQNFMIPANKETNQLFNHIFNIGSDSFTFDQRKKTPCYILVDNLMVFNGNLQLLSIKLKDKNVVSYEIIVYGESADLMSEIGDSYITDLDFSELNHEFTVDNIMSSWTANTANLGFYYPLVDYGLDLSLNDLNNMIPNGTVFNGVYQSTGGINPIIFKPALSNKYLLDKIISNAGFSYESNFFNSDAFTETITPFNSDASISYDTGYTDSFRFQAGVTSDESFSANTFGYTNYNIVFGILKNYQIKFNNTSTNGNFDNNGDFNTTNYRYYGSKNTAQRFFSDVTVSFMTPSASTIGSNSFVKFNWYRTPSGGTTVLFYQDIVSLPAVKVTGQTYTVTSKTPILNNEFSNVFYPVQVGEEIFVEIDIQASNYPFATNGYNPPSYITTTVHSADTYFYNEVYPQLVTGGLINYNNFVPKNIKCIDVLKSWISMFNIFVIPSKNNEKHLKFEPRQDYFSSGKIVDWTYKYDASQNVDTQLISESQARQFLYTYKKDSDYLNSAYFEKTNEIFGQYLQTVDNEWLDAKSQQKIEIAYSPTPLINAEGSEEIILSKIAKVDNNGNFNKTEHNIRFLRKNPQPLSTSTETIRMLGKSAQYSYPYAGHLSSPWSNDLNPIDYNFGQIQESFYKTPGYTQLQDITPNNLTYLYWKDYLDDISDKNSRIIKCKVKLTPADIANFEYNDTIFIDGLSDDGGHYFIVQKIIYTPTSDAPADVELIKVNRKPSEKIKKETRFKNFDTSIRNAISLGGATTSSKNTVALGSSTLIGSNSDFTFASGRNVVIGNNSEFNTVIGDNIIISDNVTNSYVSGTNVRVGGEIITGATSATTNVLSGITLLGVSNYTATTSDTLYVPNIQFTTTGGTINGISISAITAGSTIWTTGGTNSSIQPSLGSNNNLNIYSTIAGGYRNLIIGNYSFIGGGYRNSATTIYSSILGGNRNLINGYWSSIVGGGRNKIYNTYSSIGGGQGNKTYNTCSTIGGGKYNVSTGNYSTITGGYLNTATTSYSTVGGYNNLVSGNNATAFGSGNRATGNGASALGINNTAGSRAGAFGGSDNQATGSGSSTLGGTQNSATTAYSSVIGGSNNIVSGSRSVILGGQNITGTSNDTVYVPNLNVNNTAYLTSGNTKYFNVASTDYQKSTNVLTGGSGVIIGSNGILGAPFTLAVGTFRNGNGLTSDIGYGPVANHTGEIVFGNTTNNSYFQCGFVNYICDMSTPFGFPYNKELSITGPPYGEKFARIGGASYFIKATTAIGNGTNFKVIESKIFWTNSTLSASTQTIYDDGVILGGIDIYVDVTGKLGMSSQTNTTCYLNSKLEYTLIK